MSFYTKIKDQVAEITKQFSYPNDGTGFGHFILRECFSKIIDFEYDGIDYDSFIKEHIVDMANDLGNDAIFTNDKNNEILVFQFKYSTAQLLNTAEIIKNKKFVDWLLKINPNPLVPNAKLKRLIDEDLSTILTDENIKDNNYRITFYYIDSGFEGTIKTDIKALYTNFNDKNINFEIKFYTYEELEELYDDVEIPKNNVTLKVIPNEYFRKKLAFHDETETPVETIVTSILANSLKPIIEDKKELILALNVRYYKGENDINSKIKKEYCKGKQSNFWLLNNGINAVCSDFALDNDKLVITNFQIVNGGQTTKTLTRIVNDLPDDVQILMRLTKIQDKARTSKISMDIAVASNSQNAISTRDLHSGDRIQSKIFTYLDSVGIFYDKKDGEWATVQKKKYRNPFGSSPMHLRIHNIDIGVAYLSFFLQVPISTVGRHKLVFSDVYYDQIFCMTVNEDVQFYKLILAYRISERVSRIKADRNANFEILQNNYINDVILALSALYFFKDKPNCSIEELVENLKKINGQQHVKPSEKFTLALDQTFDDFIIEIIKSIQYILDTKKAGKKDYTGEDWLSNETNNWLKKDGTYKEIYDKVLKRLKQ